MTSRLTECLYWPLALTTSIPACWHRRGLALRTVPVLLTGSGSAFWAATGRAAKRLFTQSSYNVAI